VRYFVVWVVAVLVTCGINPVACHAECQVGKLAELPVMMDGMQPITEAKINGAPARFMIDSGAFSSIISPGTARTLGLHPEPVRDFYMVGINGTATAGLVKVSSLVVGDTNLGRAQFLVGGSETGGAGVLGQELLGFDDIEYDLPHGMVRLFKSTGCEQLSMAYWAAGRPMDVVPIAAHSREQPYTIGSVELNGKPVRATFDTGASASIVSLRAAARAGIKPGDPGVKSAEGASGFGRGYVQTWIAPFASFKIGDEEIKNTKILIGQLGPDIDMLVGADFFVAHRIYVANGQHKMFLTYEGGSIFNLKATQEDAGGREIKSPPSSQPTSNNPAELLRIGGVAIAQRDYDKAITTLTQAITSSPRDPRYLEERASAFVGKNEKDRAIADLDEAIAIAPKDLRALLARSALRLSKDDKAGAIADLDSADQSLAGPADEKYEIAQLYIEADAPARAIAPLGFWITSHPADARYLSAINLRCWARGLADQELAMGLEDCNNALRLAPYAPELRGSRGLIEFRLGQWRSALSDYNAALAQQPKASWSLFGRGVVKQRLGDVAGAKADLDAARAIWPMITEKAKLFDVAP